jgi:hypothetical protein
MWSNGQNKTTRWSISVHKGLYEEAMVKLKTMQQDLVDEYGDRINYFFHDTPPSNQRARQQDFLREEDDETWLEEDESIPEKAVIEKGFEKFFDDDQSEASWGTNYTKYTEIINPPTQSTNTSSITQEVSFVDDEELAKRHAALEFYLVKDLHMDKESIDNVRQQKPPYRLVVRAVKERIWDIDEVLDGINAIYQAQRVKKAPDPTLNNNDEI